MVVIDGIEGLLSAAGRHLGFSDWIEITQDRIDSFADATGDHQWIHVDVERAARGPFGAPVAHGHLTTSLGPMLARQVYRITGFAASVSYGSNKVRFPTPVRVGSRLRLGAELIDVAPSGESAQITLRYTFHIDGEPKPACVAEVVSRLVGARACPE